MYASFVSSLEPSRARLSIAGELDLAERDRLRAALAELRDETTGPVVLDLSRVTFIDCSCLQPLNALRREVTLLGRGFTIQGASMQFRLVCALARYDALSACISRAPLERV